MCSVDLADMLGQFETDGLLTLAHLYGSFPALL